MAKESCNKFVFNGKHLFANYCEPKESRQLAIEEKLDKKAYESHISRHMTSKSSDLVSLITSLGLILSQLNINNHRPNRPQNNNQQARPRHQSQQPTPHYQQQEQYQRAAPVVQQQAPVQGYMQMPMPMAMQQPHAQVLYPKAAEYQQHINAMFNSKEFLTSSIENRRNVIGTAIFKYVEDLVGVQHAPKVTGMIIDLDPVDLNLSVSKWENLCSKVKSAMDLLIEKGIVQAP